MTQICRDFVAINAKEATIVILFTISEIVSTPKYSTPNYSSQNLFHIQPHQKPFPLHIFLPTAPKLKATFQLRVNLDIRGKKKNHEAREKKKRNTHTTNYRNLQRNCTPGGTRNRKVCSNGTIVAAEGVDVHKHSDVQELLHETFKRLIWVRLNWFFFFWKNVFIFYIKVFL